MWENPFTTLCKTVVASVALMSITVPVLAAPVEAAEAKKQTDLRELILNAVASKQSRLVIPPGVYRVGPKNNSDGAMITIEGAKNLEIVADGVTMLCTKRMRALALYRCENVTLRGLTLDYDPLTFTQGKIVGIAPDRGYLDIKIDAGYPHILFDRIVICDPKTRFHKYGIDHLWGTKASWAEAGVVRITRPNVAINADLGDPVALSGGQEMGACHGITVEGQSSNVVFRNVTIHCAPGMGLVDFDNLTGIKMYGCKVVTGPKPAGATEERLLTTSWDGIQCQVARVGAVLEDSVIERCGDDSWSVPNREFKVVKREGNTLTFSIWEGSPVDGRLRVGDRMRLRTLDGTDFVQRIQNVKTGKMDIGGKSTSIIEVALEKEIPAQIGDFLFNLDCSSEGFIYRNNRVYSHGRGALIKVGNGIIEGNTFGGADKAIIVNGEFPNGAGGIDNLIIRNNTINETGYHQAMSWSDQAGAICLSAGMGGGKLHPAGTFNNILIENNTFDKVKGLNLFISSAKNVTVKNNRFLNTHTTDPGRHNGADYKIAADVVIEVAQSDGVSFSGNVIKNMGPYAKRAILVEPSAQRITGVESGISVAK